MHGGKRNKATDFIYWGKMDLSTLAKRCDQSHDHLPWGLTKEPGCPWATGPERNYPDLLCTRLAKAVAKAYRVKAVSKHKDNTDAPHGTP